MGNGEHIVENGIGSEIEGAWKVLFRVREGHISLTHPSCLTDG